jgi:hypothetical protein
MSPWHTFSLEELGRPSVDIIMLPQEYPLLQYAAAYWYSHIETAANIYCSLPFQAFLKEIIPPKNQRAQV